METKTKILKTALKLFINKGFTDVSLNDLISNIGITKGGFYHYFNSKEELLTDVIKGYVFSYLDKVMAYVDQYNGTSKEKIHLYFNSIPKHGDVAKHFLDDNSIDLRSFYLLLMEGIKKYKILTDYFIDINNKILNTLESIIVDGKKDGIIAQSINSYNTALHIFSCGQGALLLWMTNPEINIGYVTENNFQCVWRSIEAGKI